ncbi:hypothetical protein GQR58_016073 [Nymphon striatum]|nr:hypothetical protein GQR58_016073 [Nymphon striatum]
MAVIAAKWPGQEELDNFKLGTSIKTENLEKFANLLDISIENIKKAGLTSELGYGSLYLKLQLTQISQMVGESTQDFVSRLRAKAKFCNCSCPKCKESLEDEKIVLQNTSLHHLRATVFEKGVMEMSDVMKLAASLETAEAQARVMAKAHTGEEVEHPTRDHVNRVTRQPRKFSLLLQKSDLDIASVSPALENIYNILKRVDTKQSHYQTLMSEQLASLMDKDKEGVTFKGVSLRIHKSTIRKASEDISSIRHDFVTALTDQIKLRFPKQSADIGTAFGVLGLRNLTFVSQEQQESHGDDKIQILADFYGKEQRSKGIISQPLLQHGSIFPEWSLAKTVIKKEMYPRDNMLLLWQVVKKHHGETFPNLLKLVAIALVMPYQTADCERGFSKQNITKTPARNRIEGPALNRLLMIIMVLQKDVKNQIHRPHDKQEGTVNEENEKKLDKIRERSREIEEEKEMYLIKQQEETERKVEDMRESQEALLDNLSDLVKNKSTKFEFICVACRALGLIGKFVSRPWMKITEQHFNILYLSPLFTDTHSKLEEWTRDPTSLMTGTSNSLVPAVELHKNEVFVILTSGIDTKTGDLLKLLLKTIKDDFARQLADQLPGESTTGHLQNSSKQQSPAQETTSVVPIFDGRPENFHEWWMMFENVIEVRTSSISERLMYMRQHLNSEAWDIISRVSVTDQSYRDIKDELKQRSGSFIIEDLVKHLGVAGVSTNLELVTMHGRNIEPLKVIQGLPNNDGDRCRRCNWNYAAAAINMNPNLKSFLSQATEISSLNSADDLPVNRIKCDYFDIPAFNSSFSNIKGQYGVVVLHDQPRNELRTLVVTSKYRHLPVSAMINDESEVKRLVPTFKHDDQDTLLTIVSLQIRDDEYAHGECTKRRMENDDPDEQKLVQSMKKHDVLHDSDAILKNIMNKDVVTPEIQESLLSAESFGL